MLPTPRVKSFLDRAIINPPPLPGKTHPLYLFRPAIGDIDVEKGVFGQPLVEDGPGQRDGIGSGGIKTEGFFSGQGNRQRGCTEHGAFHRSRDRAGVADIVSQVRPGIDAGNNQLRLVRQNLAHGKGHAIGGSPVNGIPMLAKILHPEGPLHGERVAGRAVVLIRSDNHDLAEAL